MRLSHLFVDYMSDAGWRRACVMGEASEIHTTVMLTRLICERAYDAQKSCEPVRYGWYRAAVDKCMSGSTIDGREETNGL